MKIKYFVIGIGVVGVALAISGCKDERDELCALSWEEHGLGPADRIYAGQNGYDVADIDGDGWIIKPEFDLYCQATEGKTEQELLNMYELHNAAKEIGME